MRSRSLELFASVSFDDTDQLAKVDVIKSSCLKSCQPRRARKRKSF